MLKNAYKKLSISLIAIDEAHCVSSWGHDFRYSYRLLGNLRELMPNVPILAVTATATPQVRTDIIKVLKLKYRSNKNDYRFVIKYTNLLFVGIHKYRIPALTDRTSIMLFTPKVIAPL